jgi:hypothetical protein
MGGATKNPLLTCALSWGDCYRKAIESAINFGFCGMKNSRAIQRWYQDFRVKRKISKQLAWKHNLPPFLQQNKTISPWKLTKAFH